MAVFQSTDRFKSLEAEFSPVNSDRFALCAQRFQFPKHLEPSLLLITLDRRTRRDGQAYHRVVLPVVNRHSDLPHHVEVHTVDLSPGVVASQLHGAQPDRIALPRLLFLSPVAREGVPLDRLPHRIHVHTGTFPGRLQNETVIAVVQEAVVRYLRTWLLRGIGCIYPQSGIFGISEGTVRNTGRCIANSQKTGGKVIGLG